MRRFAVAVFGCLLLAGCAATWKGTEVRYKVVSVDDATDVFKVELVRAAPKGVLDQKNLTPRFKGTGEVSGGAAVGDEILCTVKQEHGSALGNVNVRTFLTECKKA